MGQRRTVFSKSLPVSSVICARSSASSSAEGLVICWTRERVGNLCIIQRAPATISQATAIAKRVKAIASERVTTVSAYLQRPSDDGDWPDG